MKKEILTAMINAVCVALPDRQVVSVAKFATMKPNSHAAKFLEHYLTGGGKTLVVDLKLLFKQDKTLAKHVGVQIIQARRNGATEGRVLVRQRNYGNKNWRNAIGTMTVEWRLVKKPIVRLRFLDIYRWHPKDDKRVSQCVHEAADNLRAKANAREFVIHGKATNFNLREDFPKGAVAKETSGSFEF
ncbi:MAG: hypothetical protein AAGJ46_13685 [Planctomycetota bacterium]